MISQGFIRSLFDCCVYLRHVSSKISIYLLLYVDGMLIASHSSAEIQSLKLKLRLAFEMKELGEARKILGMEIIRNRHSRILQLSQKAYLEKIMRKFQMVDAKVVNIPFAQHFKLSHAQSPTDEKILKEMKRIPYSNAVGSLMYAMVCSRPDLARAMSMISRFMANPGKEHWTAVKWVFRYLKGSINKVLIYGGAKDFKEPSITGYSDADYASDLDRRRSITGYVFQL